jgi:hypothetical protein
MAVQAAYPTGRGGSEVAALSHSSGAEASPPKAACENHHAKEREGQHDEAGNEHDIGHRALIMQEITRCISGYNNKFITKDPGLAIPQIL